MNEPKRYTMDIFDQSMFARRTVEVVQYAEWQLINERLAAEREHSDRLAAALKNMVQHHGGVAIAASQPLLEAGYEALTEHDKLRT